MVRKPKILWNKFKGLALSKSHKISSKEKKETNEVFSMYMLRNKGTSFYANNKLRNLFII